MNETPNMQPAPGEEPENTYGKHARRDDAPAQDAALHGEEGAQQPTEQPGKKPLLPLIGGVLAVVLLLAGLLAYFLHDGDGDEQSAAETTAAQDAKDGDHNAGNSDADNKDGDQEGVANKDDDKPFVDTNGEQEVEVEPAPGAFDGIESMAIDINGDVAPIDPVQLTDTGMLIPPLDVHRLGWYSASAVPGDEGPVGSSVITGHINYQGQGDGYAAKFVDMNVGDEFSVQIDGQPRTFRITEAPRHVPKGSDMPEVVNDTSGDNRLVLITSGGEFVGGQLGYAENIITVAEPID